jgi:hypothetical protein
MLEPNSINAKAGPVARELLISTQLYEWDVGEAQQLNAALGIVSELAQYMLTATGNPEAAVAVGIITPTVQKVVTFLGTNDDLGRRDVLWSAADLRRLTDNPERKFTGQLQFANDDATGSYTLTHEVERF